MATKPKQKEIETTLRKEKVPKKIYEESVKEVKVE